MKRWRIAPAQAFAGEGVVPGDKSISHRAVMLAALAEGSSSIRGFSHGEDNLRTLTAFRQLGVNIAEAKDGELQIDGVGLRGLSPASGDLDMGNSGTAMRLMAGLLCGQGFGSRLIGDASLSARPMLRVAEPLQQMGARIGCSPDGTAPLLIEPCADALQGGEYDLPVASAQVKSALLLAGLYAEASVSLRESGVTRNHTELMLQGMGADIQTGDNLVTLQPGPRLQPFNMQIPGDISSAAFLLVGGCIAKGAELLVRGVNVNPTRDGVLRILQRMGANIEVLNRREYGAEPVADLRVAHSDLRGVEVPKEWVPLAIDEFPVLLVAAACASGITRISGAQELRHKESDRIASTAAALRVLGVQVEELSDGIVVQGNPEAPFTGGSVDSRGDHRIAMAFAIASLRASAEIVIEDCAPVATSWPGFVGCANALGMRIGPHG